MLGDDSHVEKLTFNVVEFAAEAAQQYEDEQTPPLFKNLLAR